MAQVQNTKHPRVFLFCELGTLGTSPCFFRFANVLVHSCQTNKRGNGEEKRGKKGALFHKKRGNKGAKKRGNALRAAYSDEQFIFFFIHFSNAENINYIEGTAQGFSR